MSCRRAFSIYWPCPSGRWCRASNFALWLGLVVLLCVLAPIGSFGAEADPKFKAGEELLDAGRITQAEEFAAKALKEEPKSAAALDFDARVKFYQGRYAEALAILNRALAIDSSNQRRQALKLFSQLTLDVHKSLKPFESAHFVLFADEKRDGILVPYALDTLEKTYQTTGAELGFFPKKKSASKSPRMRPASMRFPLCRCVISRKPAPSASASSIS